MLGVSATKAAQIVRMGPAIKTTVGGGARSAPPAQAVTSVLNRKKEPAGWAG